MKSIPAFKDVLSLTLRDIKDPAVIGLACSPLERLQTLKVILIPEDAEIMFQRIPDIMLPEVTEMSLESSPHVVGLIINSMHAPKLSALTASMELVDAPVKQCITLIAERFTSSLRNLTLHIDDLDDFHVVIKADEEYRVRRELEAEVSRPTSSACDAFP